MPAEGFDYIIVGAGSAGCVIASRLTEDPDVSVLLLEAGGSDNHPLLKIPIGWTMAAADPRFGWGYMSEPEPALDGRRIPLPRGKLLGGSSSINAVRYSRGHPRDYDQWRQLGNAGWGYEDVLPYFRVSEDNWRGGNRYHGAGGPLRVRLAATPALLYEPLAEAVKAAGFAESEDIHGDVGEGLARAEMTVTRFARRHSTARAFLKPAMARKNLTVVTHALTTRIRVENGRAAGVDYVREGVAASVRAAREVILCGGSYNSPQLLLLSGIGPADELRALGIAGVHDLPGVGKNLSEHPLVPVIVETREPVGYLKHLRMDRAALWALRWFFTGRGAFAVNGNSAGMFVRTRPELERPDAQLIFAAISRDARLWWPIIGTQQKHAFQCSISLQHPEALGALTLRSADPAAPPRIQLNLFGAQSDIDTAIRAIRIARQVYASEPLKSMIRCEMLPGDAAQSDADLTAHIRRTGSITQHPSGTCKMGVDAMAVVDPELRVRGLAGLRVADASIMPTIPGGHLNATVIMIAEKASDLIRGRAPLSAAA